MPILMSSKFLEMILKDVDVGDDDDDDDDDL